MKHILKFLWHYSKICMFVFLIFTISGVIIYRFVPVPFTSLMFQRYFEQLSDGDKIKFKHDWVSIDKMSPNMIKAAIAAEDNNFVNHFGVDFDAIRKAYQYNQRGRRIRGASTITQQTCKNVFLWNGRNYLRKGLELYYTFLVEIFWSKKRIMEVYLNSIEMGDGVYGIESASQYFFHKPASKLTKGQAALIAASFPDPRRRNPAAPTPYLNGRKKLILSNMNKIGEIKF